MTMEIYDPDLFDAMLAVERHGCARYDKFDLADFLGISHKSIAPQMGRNRIPYPDRYEKDEDGTIRAIWTPEQAARARLNGVGVKSPTPRCGTVQAYNRHIRRGEPIDDPCRAAGNKDRRERAAKDRQKADA